MTAAIPSYSPKRAWGVALTYLGLLLVLSMLSGTPQRLLLQPFITLNQLLDWRWWFAFVGSLAVTIYVYGIYWSSHTLLFGRRIRAFWQVLFGSMWGLAIGLWMLSLYSFSNAWVSNAPLRALLAFALISVWQAFAQSYFWGVYVTPEHDTPRSNRTKVARCHIPHLVFSLLFFALFGNGLLFVLMQMLALSITSVAMRMPVWWERSPQLTATTKPGLIGLPRTHGWEGKVL